MNYNNVGNDGSRDSMVSILIRLNRRMAILFRTEAINFFCILKKHPDRLWGPLNNPLDWSRGGFSGGKVAEAYNSAFNSI